MITEDVKKKIEDFCFYESVDDVIDKVVCGYQILKVEKLPDSTDRWYHTQITVRKV